MQFGTYLNEKNYQSKEVLTALSIFSSATIPCPKWLSNSSIDFSHTDKAIKTLRQLNSIKTIRSNSLVWFPYPPKFLENSTMSIEELEYALFTYISSTVSKYSLIASWDVLNEAFLEYGHLRTHSSKGRLNPISKIPNWIEKIFTWAHQANPNSQLFVNDYRPQNAVKWSAVFDLVDSLLAKGIPIHGIGVQHHHHLPRCIADGLFAWGATRKICQKAKERGLAIHFTETSIWNNPNPGSFHLQALAYQQLAQCAIDEGGEHFNIWSFTDNPHYHWGFNLEDKEAGIFDEEFQPKPAYWALKGLVF